MDWKDRLEELRDLLGEDPARVRAEVRAVLVDDAEVATSPTARVRFYGLLVAACRHLSDVSGALSAFEAGQALRGSPAARAELLSQMATFHAENHDAAKARSCVEGALDLVDGEMARPEGTHPQTQIRRRGLVELKARCLVVRGQIVARLNDRPAAEALRDAFDAIGMSSHRTAVRTRIAAVSLLTGLLLRFGTLEDVRYALRLLAEADRELSRRRVRREHVNRVRIRWGKAVALARLGRLERAERMMVEVIETLIGTGIRVLVNDAVETLVWIVEEQAGQAARAAYFKHRFHRH